MPKPILCIDFDGVLHSYESGWKGATVIPDPPVPGAIEFLWAATEHFDVQIYSSRSHQEGGIEAMRDWLARWEDAYWAGRARPEATLERPMTHLTSCVTFPTVKPSALVTLDDRAITFTGTFPDVATLRAFKPWNKR